IGSQKIFASPIINQVFLGFKPILQKIGNNGVLSGGGGGLFDKKFVNRSTAPKSVNNSVLDDEWKAKMRVEFNRNVWRCAPVTASQSRIILSHDADAIIWPSGKKAIALI
ncbi:hypothetical protein PoMZ_03351, partial [Pyricularia oryzae]